MRAQEPLTPDQAERRLVELILLFAEAVDAGGTCSQTTTPDRTDPDHASEPLAA